MDGDHNYALIPAIFLFSIGFFFSSSLFLSILTSPTGFTKTTLGFWILALLVSMIVGSFGCALGLVPLTLWPTWFYSTSLPNQLYLGFRFPMGVTIALINFQIAMERYWLIIFEESVPVAYTRWNISTRNYYSSVTAETHNFRRPGGTWQTLTMLIFALQYMVIAFQGLGFLYFKTYMHVAKKCKEVQEVADVDDKGNELRMRVLTNCILMTMAFSTFYSTDAVVNVVCLVSPEWNPPYWLDALAQTLVACDTIATPFLVMHLHKNMTASNNLISSILTRISTSRSTRSRKSTTGSTTSNNKTRSVGIPSYGGTSSAHGTRGTREMGV
ncbi:hypothetical protein BDR26DRAFT_873660 [Obelidium mucronatum]|nr:hypothetical protein BDR26DRAFT_873660 [Obelidium mucronatum]